MSAVARMWFFTFEATTRTSFESDIAAEAPLLLAGSAARAVEVELPPQRLAGLPGDVRTAGCVRECNGIR
jgi:hypothetical protein